MMSSPPRTMPSFPTVTKRIMPKTLWLPKHKSQYAALFFYLASLAFAYNSGPSAMMTALFAAAIHYWGLSCAVSAVPCYTFGWIHLLFFALPFIAILIAFLFGDAIADFFTNPLRKIQQATDNPVDNSQELEKKDDDTPSNSEPFYAKHPSDLPSRPTPGL